MTVSKPKPERIQVVKTRQCLKCREEFTSDWRGERICKGCKRSHSWRDGDDFRSANG